MCLILIDVPNPLHVAIHRRIDFQELLKLIDEEGYRALLGQLHNIFEDIRKPDDPAQHRHAEFGFHLFLEALAQLAFRLFTDEEIEEGLLLVGMKNERCFSDTPSTG